MNPIVHVAAGALVDGQGRVLIAQRHADAHQGGLWEFPGGKLEAGEDSESALVRELREELGVDIRVHRPLIRIAHTYPDRDIVLHVHRVDDWVGEPQGQEGQPLEWVASEQLSTYPMPAADRPVVTALRLPDRYVITPPRVDNTERFLDKLDDLLTQGIRLIQFRVFDVDPTTRETLLGQADDRCRAAGGMLLLNAPPQVAMQAGVAGLHLSTRQLHACDKRPSGFKWVAASCHSAADLARAERLGVDFAVLSPVLPTRSHPDADPLLWERFSRLVQDVCIPVYALGGMHGHLLPAAWQSGAQGIAGIRGFWANETF